MCSESAALESWQFCNAAKMAALPVSGLRERGDFAADKVKRADGTSASAEATNKNAPQRKVGLTAHV